MRLRTPLAAALGLAAALASAASRPTPARAQEAPFTLAGFDQAWIPGKYGRDLTAAFDPDDWRQAFRRAHDAGAWVVRVWIFEGAPMQGVLWSPGDPHCPVGVDPALVDNVLTVCQIASEERVLIYWTALDGNVPSDTKPGLERDRFWNVYNNDYLFGDDWRAYCLGPVVDAIASRPDTLYALDLVNEVEAPVGHDFLRSGWNGARQFVLTTAAFVHARASIPVTASYGWGSWSRDLLAGRLDDLGLDFIDIHPYTDDPWIPDGDAVAAHAAALGLPLVMGEFGQKKSSADPALQARVVRGMLADANRLGLYAALAWRLEDESSTYTFYDGNQPRPALAEVKAFASGW
jgi:hypothetical protein